MVESRFAGDDERRRRRRARSRPTLLSAVDQPRARGHARRRQRLLSQERPHAAARKRPARHADREERLRFLRRSRTGAPAKNRGAKSQGAARTARCERFRCQPGPGVDARMSAASRSGRRAANRSAIRPPNETPQIDRLLDAAIVERTR